VYISLFSEGFLFSSFELPGLPYSLTTRPSSSRF
jgi:hypothetical protein